MTSTLPKRATESNCNLSESSVAISLLYFPLCYHHATKGGKCEEPSLIRRDSRPSPRKQDFKSAFRVSFHLAHSAVAADLWCCTFASCFTFSVTCIHRYLTQCTGNNVRIGTKPPVHTRAILGYLTAKVLELAVASRTVLSAVLHLHALVIKAMHHASKDPRVVSHLGIYN